MEFHFEGLKAIHFILAYAGAVLHILMKMAEVFNRPDFSFRHFFRKNIFPFIISLIGIPVLLIMATDESIKAILPINLVTAVFAGWQTQSLFKSLSNLYGNKKITKDK